MPRSAGWTLRVLAVLIALLGSVLVKTSAQATSPLTSTPTSLAFGSAHLGVKVAKPVSVKVAAGYQIYFVDSQAEQYGVQNVAPGCMAPGPLTCTFQAFYSPTSVGQTPGQIRVIACQEPPPSSTCSVLLIPATGTGVQPGSNSVSSLSFGTVKAGMTTVKSFTVRHDAGWAVEAAEFWNVLPDNPPNIFTLAQSVYDSCGASVTATSCVLKPALLPRLLGSQTAVIRVRLCKLSDPNLCTVLPDLKLSANAVPPGTVSVTSLAFGNVQVLTETAKVVKVTPDKGWQFAGASSVTLPGQVQDNVAFKVYPFMNFPCSTSSTGVTTCTFEQHFRPVTAGAAVALTKTAFCNTTTRICVDGPSIKLSGNGVQATSKTTLKSSASTAALGSQVTLTGTVSPQPQGYSFSNGTMTFYDGKTVLCEDVPVSVTGGAGCTATAAGATGTHPIKAVYSGNVWLKTSTSAVLYVRVTA